MTALKTTTGQFDINCQSFKLNIVCRFWWVVSPTF